MASPLILIEFNELSPPLMDRFIAAGELPNFARMRRESEVYVTDAEEQPPNLEPWIQWVTIHTGLPFAAHKVFHLNDAHKLDAPQLWDIASAEGLTSWICGSMNASYRPGLRGMVLPDPWAAEVAPSHEELRGYFEFVQRNVLEYTNEKIPLSPLDYARFALFMATHGLSPDSVIGFGLQLAEEQQNPRARWKRAAALDLLQFDVFRHYYKKLRPDFATFFANSTAHYQHYFWRNLVPQDFKLKPSAEDQAEHKDAILFGYRRMDALLGRFIEIGGDDANIVFATGLSQQPYLLYEEDGGKICYRPRDFAEFLAAVGVVGYEDVQPVMTQNFHIRFPDRARADAGAAALSALTVNGEAMIAVNPDGDSMSVGCRLHGKLDSSAMIEGGPRPLRFHDFLYLIEGVKSGMHHPDGMLWIRHADKRHQLHAGKLPLTQVAPLLLGLMSIAPPASMRAATLPHTGAPKLVPHATR
jgi:hypothetical protein